MNAGQPLVRVLAVDDSAVARSAYRLLLAPEYGFDLVATAPNADIARRKIDAMDPDVIVLDIEMPGEDGLSLLQWLMSHRPTPVVVCSTWSTRGADQTMRAFALGAVEVVCKGTPGEAPAWDRDFATTLGDAVRAAAGARRKMLFRTPSVPATRAVAPVLPATGRARAARRGQCVVIGASTGGTEALATLFTQMPADFPPVFVVQHMPPLYTRSFARRLDMLGAVRVREAADGDMIGPGEALVAPGGMQLQLTIGHAGPVARVRQEPPVNRHAPSVDVLFRSAAEHYRSRVIGVLLTGMGDDGARGLLQIRGDGGRTIAQDEASCVVYGMPQEAVKLGAAEAVLPIGSIIPQVLQWLSAVR